MEDCTRILLTGGCKSCLCRYILNLGAIADDNANNSKGGFLGSAVLRALLEKHESWSVWVLDMQSPKFNGSSTRTRFIQVDVTNFEAVESAVGTIQPDVVIHTAGFVPSLRERYRRRDEKRCLQVNVEGTSNMLQAALKVGCGNFIYTGSCTAVVDDWKGTYPNINEDWPTSGCSTIYGESKAKAENFVLAANDATFSTCILRPAAIFGEGDTQLIPPNHACIANGQTSFIIGNGNNMWGRFPF